MKVQVVALPVPPKRRREVPEAPSAKSKSKTPWERRALGRAPLAHEEMACEAACVRVVRRSSWMGGGC
eukprot:scaffold2044_cov247-Pinguiococcus_pyrenoidosus.AAC.5